MQYALEKFYPCGKEQSIEEVATLKLWKHVRACMHILFLNGGKVKRRIL
jgi:hypothetical protein